MFYRSSRLISQTFLRPEYFYGRPFFRPSRNIDYPLPSTSAVLFEQHWLFPSPYANSTFVKAGKRPLCRETLSPHFLKIIGWADKYYQIRWHDPNIVIVIVIVRYQLLFTPSNASTLVSTTENIPSQLARWWNILSNEKRKSFLKRNELKDNTKWRNMFVCSKYCCN